MARGAMFGLAVTAACVILSSDTFAQRGGGGMCGGGSGGGMMSGLAGAMAGSGMAGSGFGGRGGMMQGANSSLSTLSMLSQMAQMQAAQGVASGPMCIPSRGAMARQTARRQPWPTATQFTRTAMRYDRDDDQQLDRDELNEVAAAVIAELQARQGHSQQLFASASRSGSEPTTQTMQETFVNRAMDFDRNDDGMLSMSETTRMARALIRSLS